MEVSLEETKRLAEHTLQTSRHERQCTARTLLEDWPETPINIMNVSALKQESAERTTLGRCETVTWAAPVHGLVEYGRTDTIYHLVATALPVQPVSPPKSLKLAKHIEVYGILKNMKGLRVD
jgi:hypothetical protein